jgi:hypothetical protein
VDNIEKQLGTNTDGLLEGENANYEAALEELLRYKLAWDEIFILV